LYSISNNVDNETKVFYFGLESRLATSPFLINNPFNILFLLKGELLTENWGRGIWIENTIFTVWLFIEVITHDCLFIFQIKKY